jgi:hypothetical protein
MMAHTAIVMDIEGVAPMIEAAKAAAHSGDMLVAKEALVDASNRLSKILEVIEAAERRSFGTRTIKPSVLLWRRSGVS